MSNARRPSIVTFELGEDNETNNETDEVFPVDDLGNNEGGLRNSVGSQGNNVGGPGNSLSNGTMSYARRASIVTFELGDDNETSTDDVFTIDGLGNNVGGLRNSVGGLGNSLSNGTLTEFPDNIEIPFPVGYDHTTHDVSTHCCTILHIGNACFLQNRQIKSQSLTNSTGAMVLILLWIM